MLLVTSPLVLLACCRENDFCCREGQSSSPQSTLPKDDSSLDSSQLLPPETHGTMGGARARSQLWLLWFGRVDVAMLKTRQSRRALNWGGDVIGRVGNT